jgi:hypothetical protein
MKLAVEKIQVPDGNLDLLGGWNVDFLVHDG